MNNLAQIAELFLVTGVLSALLTGLLVRFSSRLRLTAAPTADRWHKTPTPSSGGIAILAACAVVYLFATRTAFAPIALGALCLSILGFVDDRLRLKPLPKLLVQIAVAGLMILQGYIFPATPWPLINAFFSFFWILGITNAFNLLDNIDGLCAGVTIIIAFFRIGLLIDKGYTAEADCFAIIAGGFAGFLVFNYKPARIFMGDTGSMLAGFSLATLTIASPLAHTKVFAAELAYPALTFLYPIFDTTLVSFLRRIAGRPISIGGRDHTSHRLASLGLDDRKVVWILWILTALGGFGGLIIQWAPLAVIAAAAILLLLFALLGVFLATLPSYPLNLESAVPVHSRIRRWIPSLRAGTTLALDILIAGLSLLIAFLIRWEAAPPPEQVSAFLYVLPIIMVFHGLLSLTGKTYAVAWRSFGIGDALKFARVIAVSAILTYGLLTLLRLNYFARGALIMYGIISFCVSVAVRMSLRAFQDVFVHGKKALDSKRVAIFGVNEQTESLARLLSDSNQFGVLPVAFLGYETPNAGLSIRGLPVASCRSRMRELAARYRFEAVVIPGSLGSHPSISLLEEDCLAAHVELLVLDISFAPLHRGRPIPEAVELTLTP